MLRWKEGQLEALRWRTNCSSVSRTWTHIRYITTTTSRHRPDGHTQSSLQVLHKTFSKNLKQQLKKILKKRIFLEDQGNQKSFVTDLFSLRRVVSLQIAFKQHLPFTPLIQPHRVLCLSCSVRMPFISLLSSHCGTAGNLEEFLEAQRVMFLFLS